MKINGGSIGSKIHEVAEAVTSKAKETVDKTGISAKEIANKAEISVKQQEKFGSSSRSAAEDAKSTLQLAADTSRAKLEEKMHQTQDHVNSKRNNAVSEMQAKLEPGGSVAGNVLYGASEGFDAGKKSGEQAHSDTNATGPKFIAGMAGGIVGGISGAIDGFNVGNSGGSAEDIRREARANADYSGGIAGERAMFLDDNADERSSYPRYKQYQADGGTKSYSDWHAENTGGRSSGGANAGQISGETIEAPPPAPPPEQKQTETAPSGDGNDAAWEQLQESSGANDSQYVQDAESNRDPLEQLGDYSRTGDNNP